MVGRTKIADHAARHQRLHHRIAVRMGERYLAAAATMGCGLARIAFAWS